MKMKGGAARTLSGHARSARARRLRPRPRPTCWQSEVVFNSATWSVVPRDLRAQARRAAVSRRRRHALRRREELQKGARARAGPWSRAGSFDKDSVGSGPPWRREGQQAARSVLGTPSGDARGSSSTRAPAGALIDPDFAFLRRALGPRAPKTAAVSRSRQSRPVVEGTPAGARSTATRKAAVDSDPKIWGSGTRRAWRRGQEKRPSAPPLVLHHN